MPAMAERMGRVDGKTKTMRRTALVSAILARVGELTSRIGELEEEVLRLRGEIDVAQAAEKRATRALADMDQQMRRKGWEGEI